MALNLSTQGNTARISFGAGRLYLGSVGFTPSVNSTNDVGYIQSAQLQITRQKLEVTGGFPRTLLVQYVNQEDVIFTATGIEWDMDRLAKVLATGRVTTDDAKQKRLGFGGDVNLSTVSLEFVHQMPAGGTATMRIWKAQGQGELNLALGDGVHEFPYAFRALAATTNWAGGVLQSDSTLLEVQLNDL